MSLKDNKFKVEFSAELKPVESSEKEVFKEKYLANASLDELRNFLPAGLDDRNVDLLAFSTNAYVANHVNLNGAVVDTDTAINTAPLFVFKPANKEHNRQQIVGVILNVGFSDFGTDKPITKEEAAKLNTPFNITVGGVVWRVANDNLCESIEDSNNPKSANYNKISASFEMGFDDYDIAVLPAGNRYLENANIVTDGPEKEELSKNLKSFGGSGKVNDKDVALLIKGTVVPLGIAFTTKPAAAVQGVAVPKDQIPAGDGNNETVKELGGLITGNNVTTVINNDSIMPKSAVQAYGNNFNIDSFLKSGGICIPTIFSYGDNQQNTKYYTITNENGQLGLLDPKLNKYYEEMLAKLVSHKESNIKDCVKPLSQEQKDSNNTILTEVAKINLIKPKYMKFTKLEEVADTELRQNIDAYVATELAKASEKYAADKKEKEGAIESARVKTAELETTLAKTNTRVADLEKELTAFKNEKAARESQEKFNSRIASFDEKYELTKEDRKAISAQIKDLNDDAFNALSESLHVLLATKDKLAIAEAKKQLETSASTVIDDAVDNSTQVTTVIPNTITPEAKTFKDKFAKAFSDTDDNFNIIYNRRSLNAKSKE